MGFSAVSSLSGQYLGGPEVAERLREEHAVGTPAPR
jgi:hypothetical protein